jgi:CHAT domain-containing protein
MKSIRELVEMPGGERQGYLQQRQAEITLDWVQLAKRENDQLASIDPGQAVRLAEVILQAAQAWGDPMGLALAHWAQGNAYMMDDRPREAIACFEQAAQLYMAAGLSLDVARVELSRMVAETDLGYPDRALETASRIGPILEGSAEGQDRVRLAKLAGNSGIALELRGDYEDALAAYERKQKIIQELAPDDEVQIARVEQNRAVALTKLNRFDEAAQSYRRALKVLEDHQIVSDVARAYTNLGWMHSRAGHDEQVAWAFDQARNWLGQLSDEDSLQAADLALSVAYWNLERNPAAVIAEAAHLRRDYAGRTFLYAQEAALLEARARLQTGDTAGARRVCAEVEQALAGRFLAGLLWQVRHLTGRAWQQDGNPAQARVCYEEALDMIERDQSRIADVHLRASALEDKLAVYQDLVALLAQEQDFDAALRVIERSKARALVDALWERLNDILSPDVEAPNVQRLLQELQDLRAALDRRYRQQGNGLGNGGDVRAAAPDIGADVARLERAYVEKARELSRLAPRYGTVLGTCIASTGSIRQVLPRDALLVEYYAVRGQFSALVLTPDGTISHHPLCQVADVERLVKQLPRPPLSRPERQVWEDLYNLLVAPWASLLEDVRHLVVIPDGALHYVPFQALRCPETGRYLVEDHEIRYAPSATLLVLTTQARAVRRDVALVLGYDGGQLVHVPAEMGAIAGTFSGLTLFTGDQASRAQLERLAAQADVIHIAAHGDFRPDAPLFSFVALADGRWQVADVYRQRLNASLVTLGACQTGRGRLTGSDLIGFAHALFYAGAQAVLASLWPVHDASTAALMAALYRGIRQGRRKAAALRQAQLALLQTDQWRDPLYWAPFCLIGADGVVGATGLMRAVRQIVTSEREGERLSPASSEALLERLTRMVEAYDKTGDAGDFAGQLARAVEELPELRTLLATVPGSPLDLDQTVAQVGRMAGGLMTWRYLPQGKMDKTSKAELALGAALPLEGPIYNETVEETKQLVQTLEEAILKVRNTDASSDQPRR